MIPPQEVMATVLGPNENKVRLRINGKEYEAEPSDIFGPTKPNGDLDVEIGVPKLLKLNGWWLYDQDLL